ncbi:MAG: hypothetical protein R2755_17075 [Acidimicrobiales bacterium]
MAHPLNALVAARLVEPAADALRQKRTTFRLAEPMLRFHHLVIEPNEAQARRERGPALWRSLQDTVSSRIYGPHFEHLARTWCLEHAEEATLGGTALSVAATTVACRTHRSGHGWTWWLPPGRPATPGGSWPSVKRNGDAEPCDVAHLERLEHARDVLGAVGARLLLFSRSGFTRGLHAAARRRGDVELIDLERLYRGS